MALAGRISLIGVGGADKFRRRPWRDEHVEAVVQRRGRAGHDIKARHRGGGTNTDVGTDKFLRGGADKFRWCSRG